MQTDQGSLRRRIEAARTISRQRRVAPRSSIQVLVWAASRDSTIVTERTLFCQAHRLADWRLRADACNVAQVPDQRT